MKNILLTFLFILISTVSYCQTVSYEIVGKCMAVKFHNDGDVTIDKIKVEFSNILDLATKKKCKSVMIRKNDMMPWVIFTSIDRVYGEKYFNYLMEYFAKLQTTGQAIEYYTVSEDVYEHIPAKYVSKTYINGKLHDVYESDWEHGYFKPETHTHKYSNGDVYKVETYYQWPSKNYKETIEVRKSKMVEIITTTSLEGFVSTICF